MAFLSNFTATSVNLFYAAAEQVILFYVHVLHYLFFLTDYFFRKYSKQMADLYVLHLANTIVNFIWWILFFAILWKGFNCCIKIVTSSLLKIHLLLKLLYLYRSWLPDRRISLFKLQIGTCAIEYVFPGLRCYWQWRLRRFHGT